MTYSIIYSSAGGNTARLAQALREALPPEDRRYFGPPDPAALEAELVFAGFWTDKGTCCAPVAEFLPTAAGKRVALFGSAGFGGSTAYFEKILERVRARLPSGAEYAGGWMCQGRMSDAVRERYAALLEQAPGDERAQGMLENFDQALPHPDGADLEALKAWAREMV